MENLQRRASGFYVARLTVPQRLRHLVGRREFIASTGTRHLAVAKLVASAHLAQWRQRLLDLDRLALTGTSMHHDSIIKIADGHPLLGTSGHLPLRQAAAAVGLEPADLLRQVVSGRVRLFHRFDGVRGYLLPLADLKADIEPGSRIVPAPERMPDTAGAHTVRGVLALPAEDCCDVATALLAGSVAEVVLFDAPGGATKTGFAPDDPVTITLDRVEVAATEIELLRLQMARTLQPSALESARAAAKAAAHATPAAGGKMAEKRFSEAVAAYCSSPDGLPGGLASIAEQRQRKAGLLLFGEFMGDVRLADIDGDLLRAFRDGPLKTLPGNANRLPKEIKKDSMKATIEALKADGRSWPPMSLEMQRERMLWLFRLFAWLHNKGYLSPNPAATLAGETGMTKAERTALKRVATTVESEGGLDSDDEGRGPFDPDELTAIFGMQHYKSGNGSHVVNKNQAWYPFEYWLPLLGLFAGCRIKEACQLHLSDIRQVEGVWCLDLNQRTEDKSLKNDQSARIVPIHPRLLDLGLVGYANRLREAGYRRLFPELTHANTDARYAKEPGRKMSAMLKKLGMPRDNFHVFHCLRHNANNALARVPMAVLPYADEGLKKYIRYSVLGHKPGDDVNVRHYTRTTKQEMAALVGAMAFDLPSIAQFDIEHGLNRVRSALDRKLGERKGREDMGPLNE